MTEESLTQESTFDMLKRHAEIAAEANESISEDEVEDEVDESPEPEPEEDEEEGLESDSEPEDEESEDDDDLEDPEENLPEEEEEPDPETQEAEEEIPPADQGPSETDLLREQNQKLMDLVKVLTSQKEKPSEASAPAKPHVDPEKLQSALFGTNPEIWNSQSDEEKAKYSAIAKKYVADETRYAIDPQAKFREHYEELVQKTVADMMGPVLQNYHKTETQSIIRNIAGDLWDDSGAKQRVLEIYHAQPASKSQDMSLQEGAFKLAVEQVRLEREREEITKLRTEHRAKSKQEKARKPGRRNSKRRSRVKGSKKRSAEVKTGDDILSFFRAKMKEQEGS